MIPPNLRKAEYDEADYDTPTGFEVWLCHKWCRYFFVQLSLLLQEQSRLIAEDISPGASRQAQHYITFHCLYCQN